MQYAEHRSIDDLAKALLRCMITAGSVTLSFPPLFSLSLSLSFFFMPIFSLAKADLTVSLCEKGGDERWVGRQHKENPRVETRDSF